MDTVYRTVYLKSGLACFVLAEYRDKLWLIGRDGSWGPGTIKACDVSDTSPKKYCPHCNEKLPN